MADVLIDWDSFRELLDARREEVYGRGWTVPDCVWDYAMELLEEMGGLSAPEYNNPPYIVDNLAINGSWEDFEDARESRPECAEMSDEEMAKYLQDSVEAVFPEEKIVFYGLGL